jgi:hypothetical protein
MLKAFLPCLFISPLKYFYNFKLKSTVVGSGYFTLFHILGWIWETTHLSVYCLWIFYYTIKIITLCNFLPYSSIKANILFVDGWAVNNDMLEFFKKNSYVDGWAINIWHVFISTNLNVKIWKYKLVICWWLSRQHMTSFYFSFNKTNSKTCHMLTAEPST